MGGAVNFLFVHQNYPAQYLHLIRHLLDRGGHQIVFISEANSNSLPGVRRVLYQVPPFSQEHVHPYAHDLDRAARRSDAVIHTARNVKRLGFEPDIIIGHHGWGELLNIGDVFPGVPLLGYFEFYYRENGQDVGFDPEFPFDPANRPRIRAMNAVNLMAHALGQHGQTPTKWPLACYPDWMQSSIDLIPEGALLDSCMPDPAARTQPFARRFVNSGRLSLPTAYSASPLSTPDRDAWAGGPAPGAPAPDAPLTTPDGTPTHLLKALGRGFTLLVQGCEAPAGLPESLSESRSVLRVGDGAGCWRDAEGLVARRYDAAAPAAYLIRPDGHVAARFRAPDAAAITAAITAALHKATGS